MTSENNATDILFADDDAAMREMVSDVLKSAGYNVRLAHSGAAGLAEIRSRPPSLAVLDFRMGTPDGLEVCREVKSDPRLEHIPVLILTGEGSVEDRIGGFEAGADDYLAKPFDARELLARVRALLRLSDQGLHRNPTSGLPGGAAIEREFDRRREAGTAFAICYFDVDHFKPFSDRFGFTLADRAIRLVAEILKEVARDGEFVGHVGGDDFLLMCDAASGRQRAQLARALFAARLARLVPEQDVKGGAYEGVDRDGEPRKFAIPGLSVAVVRVAGGLPLSLSQLAERIADAKRKAKLVTGIEEIDIVR